jgi:ATP-dependent Clp protease protease subunit
LRGGRWRGREALAAVRCLDEGDMLASFLQRLWHRIRGPRWAARYWPDVVRRAGGEEALADWLLERRIIALTGPLLEETLEYAIARLLFLQDASPSRPAEIWIHSPGGHAVAALAFYDTMMETPFPISTYCFGHAGGVAALLLAAGARGERSVDPYCRVSLVDMSLEGWRRYGTSGEMRSLHKVRMALNQLLAAQADQDVRAVAEATRTETHLSAKEAIAYGFADRIQKPPPLFRGGAA